jgi:tRNA (cytidine32/uridine32-2'-O)-methyltransferase
MLERIRVVMVEPSHPGNIGAAARAMKTMGLSDLRLVSPREYPSAEATARASGAGDVLGEARVCADLDEAVHDATLVAGTSARRRRIPWPRITARQFSGELARQPESARVALVFGRESTGLTNDELHRCHLHVALPTNPEYGVLNVAAAIQLLAYEARLGVLGDSLDETGGRPLPHSMPLPEIAWDEPPASSDETEGFLLHLQKVMEVSGFFRSGQANQAMTRLRRLFLRARPDRTEISTLRGVLANVEKTLRREKSDV